jgi:putative oxidoreductase
MWAFLSRNRDAGQLILRLLLGAVIFWLHGWRDLAGGVGHWRDLGVEWRSVGIRFWPEFWGFLTVLAGSVGIALFMIGAAFRPACLFITIVLIVATVHDASGAKTLVGGLRDGAKPLELAIVFFSLMFIGPGKYSVDKN